MSEAKIVRTRQSKRKVNELISFFESANKKLACEVGDLERQRNTLSTVLMFHLQLNKHQQQLPPPVLPVCPLLFFFNFCLFCLIFIYKKKGSTLLWWVDCRMPIDRSMSGYFQLLSPSRGHEKRN